MYDIFISYKNTDNNHITKDYTIAKDLYQKLIDLGYNCFFSAETILENGKSNYSKIINNALDEAQLLILVATSLDYINSRYVEREWESFDSDIICGIKPNGELITYLEDINVHDLPRALRHRESFKVGEEEDKLLKFITNALPLKKKPEPVKKDEPTQKTEPDNFEYKDYTREEIVDLLIKKIHEYKYPYLIYSKVKTPELREKFLTHAYSMFDETVAVYKRGLQLEEHPRIIDIIVDQMTTGEDAYVRVEGLPGSAKNMILQLAFYEMLDKFKAGESNYLPFYISSSYYEKLKYDNSNVREDMKKVLTKVFQEFFYYIENNPGVKPVLFVEAIREHKVSKFAPEDIISELWRKFGKFNRTCAIDVGLIKNKTRHKRNISLELNKNEYVFVTKQIPIDDSVTSIKLINSVFNMYNEEYYYIDAFATYNRLKEFQFPTIDIFLIRLIATGYMGRRQRDDISIIDVYEGMAFDDIKYFIDRENDEQSIRYVSEELYKYVFENNYYSFNEPEYNAVLWSLPHKHNTYLEFLIAYYFIYRIEHYTEYSEQSFFAIMHTSMSNHFVASYLKDDYERQETMLRFISENYNEFDIQQKSNATYWLGRINMGSLKKEAIVLLTREFANLKKDIEFNNKKILENCNNHFLFRSICNGLHSQNQANMMDEYLRIVVSNDIANAINRGAIIEYYSENYSILNHDRYNLDDNLAIGEQSIKILLSRIESVLFGNNSRFVEIDLITVLCLLQTRIQAPVGSLKFDIKPYVRKALDYLNRYKITIPNVSSPELIDYFNSVEDDLALYLEHGAFDIGQLIYNQYNTLKDVKRTQWLNYQIDDSESVSEHLYNAWMLGMFFLPEEDEDPTYLKKEILDMLLVHDMAEAIVGDENTSLYETTRELSKQNQILKKLFLKGTYPDLANLTYYYKIWTHYYKGASYNAKIARDINAIQTVYSFCSYYCQTPDKFTTNDIAKWLDVKRNLKTILGHTLFDRIITNNKFFQKIFSK